jgi:hypothetical protein
MTIFLNSPEECGDEISAGLTTRIDLACTKKQVKSVICVLRNVLFCRLQRLIQNFGMICPITLKDENCMGLTRFSTVEDFIGQSDLFSLSASIFPRHADVISDTDKRKKVASRKKFVPENWLYKAFKSYL